VLGEPAMATAKIKDIRLIWYLAEGVHHARLQAGSLVSKSLGEGLIEFVIEHS
jgi:hypothetical protein